MLVILSGRLPDLRTGRSGDRLSAQVPSPLCMSLSLCRDFVSGGWNLLVSVVFLHMLFKPRRSFLVLPSRLRILFAMHYMLVSVENVTTG